MLPTHRRPNYAPGQFVEPAKDTMRHLANSLRSSSKIDAWAGNVDSRIVHAALLLMALIQFSSIWLYGPSLEWGDELVDSKAFGIPFQYALWLFIVLTVARQLGSGQGRPLLQGFLPLLPFWLSGLLATFWSWDFAASARSIILWMMMALCATVTAANLPTKTMRTALFRFFFAATFLSCVYSVAVPAFGQESYGLEKVWRGLFIGKNQLGWVSSFALVVAILFAGLPFRLRVLLAACAALCLLQSGSATALVAAFCAIIYGHVILALRRLNLSPVLASLSAIVGTLLIAAFIPLIFVPILDAFGRDITLTGRTYVWDIYLEAMRTCHGLGCGPRAFTGPNELTEPLSEALPQLGRIYQPHNMFIGAYGEAGIAGLLALVIGLGYITLVEPFRSASFTAAESGAIGMLCITGGLTETRELFAFGIGTFMLILWRAAASRDAASIASANHPHAVKTEPGKPPRYQRHITPML
jgi:exopolysaccharide production protein ExoQ